MKQIKYTKMQLLLLVILVQIFINLPAKSAQWIELNSGSNNILTSTVFKNHKIGYAVSSPNSRLKKSSEKHGEIISTDDGGATWTKNFVGDSTYYFKAIEIINNRTIIASGFKLTNKYSALIVSSNDSGKTWQEISSPHFEDLALMSISTFLDTNIVVVGSKVLDGDVRGVALISRDRGANWQKLEIDTNQISSIYKIVLSSPNSAYFDALVYDEAQDDLKRALYHSVDNFKTWQKVNLPFDDSTNFITFDFYLDNTGFVAGYRNDKAVLFKTNDAGKNWHSINLPNDLTGLILNFKFMNNHTIVALVDDYQGYNKLLVSQNDGYNWLIENIAETSEMSLNNFNFAFLPQMMYSNYAYVVGDYGKILRGNVSNNPSAALISIEKNNLKFFAHVNEKSEAREIKLQFDNINDKISIMMPEDFEISDSRNGEYKQMMILESDFAKQNNSIFVRFAPKASGEMMGELVLRSNVGRLIDFDLYGQTMINEVDDENGQDENMTNKIHIYPNPSQDILHINTEAKAWEMRDLGGKVLGKGNQNVIDISKLAPGVYYIEIWDTTSQTIKSFIKY
jgi:photosystem II stability/assembly factor-like uncharacterized protein